MPQDSNHEELKKLLVENQRLLLENNQLLHKMRRSAVIGTFLRLIWFLILIGGPVYVYFNYIEPNMGTIKEKINNFEQMTSETDAFKKFYESVNNWNPNQ